MGTAAPGAGGDAEAGDAAAEEAAGETADCAGAGAGAFNARSSAHAALGSK
jgi:hypothetical protein